MISIHHASASWQDKDTFTRWREIQDAHRHEDTVDAIIHTPNRVVFKVLGEERYEKLKKLLKGQK